MKISKADTQKKTVIQKKAVKQDMIKANIYDNVELFIDVSGTSDDNFNKIGTQVEKLFATEKFERYEDVFSDAELNAWNMRNDNLISPSRLKNILNTERKIVYSMKDKSERIILSKFFFAIELYYDKKHSLGNQIVRMKEIAEIYTSCAFVEIKKVTLKKNNSILCNTVYRLYQCLERSAYGDIEAGLKKAASPIDYQSENVIDYGDYSLVIQKNTISGSYDRKNCFYARLNFQSSCSNQERFKDISEIFTDMNKILFELFINTITTSFCNDLIRGESKKVMEGVKKNEN